MGFVSWWRGNGAPKAGPYPYQDPKGDPLMNGAVEVRRPTEVTAFEFGSMRSSGGDATLAGYCPVSEELEPCRWVMLLAVNGSEAPLFRVVF